MKPTFYIAAAALLLAMPACVSKKKYLLAESGRLAALEREADLKERLIASEDENASLSSRLSALLRDTADLGRQAQRPPPREDAGARRACKDHLPATGHDQRTA